MNLLNSVRNKVDLLRGTDLEKKVKEATSNENWGAPSTLMYEIAQATYDYAGYREVVPLLFKRLGEDGRLVHVQHGELHAHGRGEARPGRVVAGHEVENERALRLVVKCRGEQLEAAPAVHGEEARGIGALEAERGGAVGRQVLRDNGGDGGADPQLAWRQ